MGHLTDIPYLDSERIDLYLRRLSEIIAERSIGKHSVLIVGGAAIAMKYVNRRSTVDIDICIQEHADLYDCCRQVAAEYMLPDDWINADVMHSDSFSYRLFDNAELYRSYNEFLDVYIAADIDLYCMKIVSFRPKDVQDMTVIASKLKQSGTSFNDIENNMIRLYGSLYYLKNDFEKELYVKMQLQQL